jgi:hypothetical protein
MHFVEYILITEIIAPVSQTENQFPQMLVSSFADRVAQSVWRLATGWTVRGSNPGGGEFLRTSQDQPWGPPSLLYNGYRGLSRG